EQSKDVFLNELMRVLKIREECFNLFWKEKDWHNFMFVITGSDRIGHFFWDIYENPNDAHHEKFLDFFREIDAFIGDIVLNKLHENDRFVILSDHGMERITQNVNVNTYLEKEGYLSLSEKPKNYNRITEETKAFCLDPGRIYLNKKGKFPRGSVGKDEKKEILENLKDILTSLKYKKKKVIKHIHEKQDIYSGKMIRNAPDLVLIENPGYRLKGVIGKRETFSSPEKFSGKHNGNAFLITNKDTEINQPKVENVLEFLQ
ncbi:MAG: alkaline phosphatase family protein, partial [Promethearchaeia archaeon]